MSNDFSRLASIFEGWLDSSWQNHDLFSGLSAASLSAVRVGGKRFRPVLCLTVGEILNVPPQALKAYTLALELIHSASLIHDDLPGLDNAAERRGRPTVHREFGEAAAIMAGDLLISEAFRVISESAETDYEVRARWVSELARANALICSGQLREFALQGRGPGGDRSQARAGDQNQVIEEKTAALIRAAVMGAPILLGSRLESEKWAFWSDFGMKLGVLFQLRDDHLDGDADAEHQGWGETILAKIDSMIKYSFFDDKSRERLNSLVEFVWGRGA